MEAAWNRHPTCGAGRWRKGEDPDVDKVIAAWRARRSRALGHHVLVGIRRTITCTRRYFIGEVRPTASSTSCGRRKARSSAALEPLHRRQRQEEGRSPDGKTIIYEIEAFLRQWRRGRRGGPFSHEDPDHNRALPTVVPAFSSGGKKHREARFSARATRRSRRWGAGRSGTVKAAGILQALADGELNTFRQARCYRAGRPKRGRRRHGREAGEGPGGQGRHHRQQPRAARAGRGNRALRLVSPKVEGAFCRPKEC